MEGKKLYHLKLEKLVFINLNLRNKKYIFNFTKNHRKNSESEEINNNKKCTDKFSSKENNRKKN